MKTIRWYDGIFVVVFLYLFVLQINAIWPFTIDDMYISLRYARHWAAGDGLLWNLQAPPVEGYSNFSFVVLAALALVFHLDPVITLKIAGIAGLFFTCIFIFLISRFWFDKRQALIPCIWLLLYKGQIIWAASGLETTVYQALICGAILFAFQGMGYRYFPGSRDKAQPWSLVMSGLMLSFAGMTRPEAPPLMLMFLLILLWDSPRSETVYYWRGVGYFVLTLLLTFAPYFIWRWHHFGFLFPNSVYCKGISAEDFLSLDVAYLKLVWPFALLAIPACIGAGDKRFYFLWMPGLLYLLMLADADPVVGFFNRFFLTAFVLMLPMALLGIQKLLLWCLKERDSTYYFSFYSVVLFLIIPLIPSMTLAQYHYFTENPQAGDELRRKVITWLNTHAKSTDVVVLGDSGMIPYFSDLKFIDSYCLNNKTMAHYPLHQRYELFCTNILHEKPQIFILTSLIDHGEVIYTPSDLCLKKTLDKHSGYKLVDTMYSKEGHSRYRYEMITNF